MLSSSSGPRTQSASGSAHGSRSSARRVSRRVAGLPAPLRGVWEAIGPLLLLGVLTALPVVLLGIRGAFQGMSRGDVAHVAGLAFVLNQGVPVAFSLPAERGLAAAEGVLAFTPLFGVLLLAWLSSGAGRRIRAASTTRFGSLYASLFFMATVAGTNVIVALMSRAEFAWADPIAAGVIPALWSVGGLLVGACAEAGGLLAFIGRRRWLQAKGQWWIWAADYVRTVFRAVAVALLTLLAASAVALGTAVLTQWAPVLTAYEGVSTSVVGATAVTLGHVAYLPNALIWTMAWLSGAGFSFGTDSVISPLATTAGALPPFPILAAAPLNAPSWAAAALAVPALCGAVASWWFLREGEDHLGEWFELKMGPGFASQALGMVVNAVIVGLLTGVAGALAALVSRGSLGIGRFTDLGPDPLQVLWMLGVDVFIGALVGFLVVPWLESD